MTNDIRIYREVRVGEGFIPSRFLQPGENEYRIRDEQLRGLGKEPAAFRPLSARELEVLVRNNNTCNDWTQFLVMDPFCPELLRNNSFFGLIRISRLEHITLEHHDISAEVGIVNSQLIACDIGDNCIISNCAYLSHYIIDDHCVLINNAEIQVSNHAKFGNGIVMESEDEEVRITLDVMNENGGRAIFPFDGILPGDAWLWAKFRDRKALMERFAEMTNTRFDRRLGRYGVIGRDSVLKHNRIIKDTYIGESAYIKGSNKLKNLTINSSAQATTQIGEGVELVNGILGFGCRVFYGCKAVRFVMCDNSALKYGARLIHSVLGENSTVSCCEILNNLIFPSHEQHHNTSFLIASLIKGQSNLAAGATIGSNHNSRAPDGEIEAGRGFWPGLCTSVKHSSRFASFCLLSKGDYKHELDIQFPFCLVDNDETEGRLVLAPAWWWHSNAYALMRNEKKFKERDKRRNLEISYIYSPFAPDTASEILQGLAILERAVGAAAVEDLDENENTRSVFGDRVFELIREARAASAFPTSSGGYQEAHRLTLRKVGAWILATTADPLPFEVRVEGFENSARPQIVLKPCRAWRSYREMLLWFAVRQLLPELGRKLAEKGKRADAAHAGTRQMKANGAVSWQSIASSKVTSHVALHMRWENLGGFLVETSKLERLISRVEEGRIESWDELHDTYRELASEYGRDASAYAWSILRYLALFPEATRVHEGVGAGRRTETDIGIGTVAEKRATSNEALEAYAAFENGSGNRGDQGAALPALSESDLAGFLERAKSLSIEITQRVFSSRAKDLSNPFRKATFRNEAEQLAVCGRVEDNNAIQSVRREMEEMRAEIDRLLSTLGATE